MPIYAYRCANCGHAQDVLQKMSDPLLSVCPACGAEAYTKQVTAAGFQLKGSGWYVTDFRGGKKPEGESKEGAKADAKAPAPGDAKSDTRSDAKSDAKGDAKSEAKPGSKADAGVKTSSSEGAGKTPAAPASAPTSKPAFPPPAPAGPKTAS